MMQRDRSYAKGFYQNRQPSRFAPPSPEAAGMDTHQPRCRHCHEEILFLPMLNQQGEPTGNRMPVDKPLRHGDGRRHLVVRVEVRAVIYGRLIVRAPEEVHGFEPHHGTCPVLLRKRKIEKAKQSQETEREVGRAWLDEMLGGAE